MKKTLLFTLLAFVATGFMSCDDKEELETTDSGIVGTWEGDFDEYHYPIATFKADGTYEWEWAGIHKMKDTGTYTYEEGKKIVMKPSKYYEYDDEKGKYVTGDPGYTGNRNCRIIELYPDMMRVNLSDYFMGGGQGEGFDFILYRKGMAQNIKAKDLEGTWEYSESDGSLSQRVIITENKYTAYEVWIMDSTLCVEKSVGTWSLSKNELTVKPTDLWFSYERVGTGYEYSPVNPETLEAETWTKASYTVDTYKEKIYLAGDKLYVSGRGFIKKK